MSIKFCVIKYRGGQDSALRAFPSAVPPGPQREVKECLLLKEASEHWNWNVEEAGLLWEGSADVCSGLRNRVRIFITQMEGTQGPGKQGLCRGPCVKCELGKVGLGRKVWGNIKVFSHIQTPQFSTPSIQNHGRLLSREWQFSTRRMCTF